jgi:putative heme transporter
VQRAPRVPATEKQLTRRSKGSLLRRAGFAALSLGIVAATFVYFLPTIANYGDVWGVVKELSWQWVAVLLAATVVYLVTFAPPWQVALPGLAFLRAMQLSQASTALSIVVPGGGAVGAAAAFGMLRKWRFPSRDVSRALTLTTLWTQFLNLSFPIVAVFLLTVSGEHSAALATAAFVGVAVLGIAVAAFVVMLVSERLARDIGDLAARFASWARGKLRRGPVAWTGASFERFRREAGDFLERNWPALTVASLALSLSAFVLLVASLRGLGVPSSQVSLVEAFAAWALVRLLVSVPITPGGLGVVELGLTGALVAFGGSNARVVAAVLTYRFLTVVPTLLLGLAAAFTFRRGRTDALPLVN